MCKLWRPTSTATRHFDEHVIHVNHQPDEPMGFSGGEPMGFSVNHQPDDPMGLSGGPELQ